jgi:ubiquinone/menaquinone biosynthesis C-methylase UbiE
MSITAESLQAEESRIRDVYAQRSSGDLYSCFNPAYLFMVQERERYFLHLLSKVGGSALAARKILEIGCGNGDLLRDFIRWGARPENISGIELIPERIAEAKTLCPQTISIQQGNAAEIGFPDETFDLVVQSTVFTSVLDTKIKTKIASEMRRVLKPSGFIIWYDFSVDNPNNKNVKGVNAREIRRLFKDCDVYLKRITLAQPILRRVAAHSWLLCCLLSQFPFLCTHYIGVIKKI